MAFLREWFVVYWRWTTLPLITVTVFICWQFQLISFRGYYPQFNLPQFSFSQVVPSFSDYSPAFSFYLILSVLCIAIYRWTRGKLPPAWITVTAIASPLFLWGFWLLKPEWYIEWRHSEYFIWMLAVSAALGFLASLETSSLAKMARMGLLLLMSTAVCMGAYGKWQGWEATRQTKLTSGVHSFAHIPQDTRLQILADAETGDGSPGSGKHTDKFGKLIVNDKNRDGSIDRGKWQINSGHDAEAKRLGIDVTSEEGNRRMAIVLMQKNPDLRDWNASRHRWGPKLLALSRGMPPLASKPAEAEVSQEIPPSPRRVTVAKISSRRGRHADVASAKYCWTTTRGARHRYSDPIVTYNSVSPAETVSFEGKRGKKLVCVW